MTTSTTDGGQGHGGDANSDAADDDNYPAAITIGDRTTPVLPSNADDVEPAGDATLPFASENSILSGRGAIFGKSGAGKSNTVNVVVEEILRAGRPFAIIDPEGEYYGIKQQFENVLLVGRGENVEHDVGPEHGAKLAELALENNLSVILDVSGYLHDDEVHDLLYEFTSTLFAKAKELKRPFPVFVEEGHEYIPEGGRLDDLRRMLVKIGKRGRKHGLGLVVVSQRPADVKKDYVTQCDWIVWHRLTWNNDTRVVKRILSSEYADAVEGLGDGEAFLLLDWADDVQRVQIRRQDTYDAGKRPTLADETDPPDLKSVDEDLLAELADAGSRRQSLEDRVEQLQAELADRESEIEALEEQLETREYVSEEVDAEFGELSGRLADAFEAAVEQATPEEAALEVDGDTLRMQNEIRAEVARIVRDDLGEQVATLEAERADLRAELSRKDEQIEELTATVDEQAATIEDQEAVIDELHDRIDELEQLEARLGELREIRDRLTVILGDDEETPYKARAREEAARADRLAAVLRGEEPPSAVDVDVDVELGEGSAVDASRSEGSPDPYEDATYVQVVEQRHRELQARVADAAADLKPSEYHIWDVLFLLAEVADGVHEHYHDETDARPTTNDLIDELEVESRASVNAIVNALAADGVALIEKHEHGPQEPHSFSLNGEVLEQLDELAARRDRRASFRETARGDE